jgi:hypothetical protein
MDINLPVRQGNLIHDPLHPHPTSLGQFISARQKVKIGEQILTLPACGSLDDPRLAGRRSIWVNKRLGPAIPPLEIAGDAGTDLAKFSARNGHRVAQGDDCDGEVDNATTDHDRSSMNGISALIGIGKRRRAITTCFRWLTGVS